MSNPFNKASRPAQDIEAPANTSATDLAAADATRAARLMEMISVADTGKQLVEFLKDRGIAVRFLDTMTAGDTIGTCVLKTSRIEEQSPHRLVLEKPVINLLRSASDDKAAMALLHEGRHAMQAESGLHPLTRYLSRDDTRAYIRMVEADAGSFTILTALKIFLTTGDDSIIKTAIRTQADDECTAKIVNLVSEHGRDIVGDPAAQRALFDAWFNDKAQVARYDGYSDLSWQKIDAAVQASLGAAPVPAPLKKEDFLGLGTLTHAENYLTIAGMADVTKACGLTEARPAAPKAPRPPSP